PFLDRIFKAGRIRVIGVSEDDREATLEFLQRFELDFPSLIAPLPYPVSSAYGLTNVPSTFLVEQDQSISWASTGFHKGELQELANRLTTQIFRPDDRVPEWKPG